MIEFVDLRVRYPRQTRDALAGVSIVAPRGVVTAVVGPNGSGKSTLVRALIGRVAASGAIRIDGVDAGTMARDEIARRVAVVTQREDAVFPIDVREYVALGRLPHRGAWGREGADDHDAIERAIDMADVRDLASRSVHQLSGGEWQRIRVARALAQGGDALVVDEPTTFLDVGHEMAVFELLGRLARDGKAVLLVSHQLNLVARFADRLVLLDAGAIAAAGPVDEVMRADVLERVYRWPVVVTRDAAVGAPTLVPLRRSGGMSTPSTRIEP